jgi:hypothetical protein
MKVPDFASLDPPGQPGETISWCPMCGDVIYRRPADDLRTLFAVVLAEGRPHVITCSSGTSSNQRSPLPR